MAAQDDKAIDTSELIAIKILDSDGSVLEMCYFKPPKTADVLKEELGKGSLIGANGVRYVAHDELGAGTYSFKAAVTPMTDLLALASTLKLVLAFPLHRWFTVAKLVYHDKDE